MRKHDFRMFRRRLVNKKWLTRKYRELLERSREIENFYDFECSVFFRGEHLANFNTEIYYQNRARNDARLRYIAKRLDNLK